MNGSFKENIRKNKEYLEQIQRQDRPELMKDIVTIIMNDEPAYEQALKILALFPDEEQHYNPNCPQCYENLLKSGVLKEAKEQLLEKITEDIIEMAGNFYMNDTNRKLFYKLWKNFK